jgi:hypothetical protein
MSSPSSWPLERPEQLAEALGELDATPAEIAEWLPLAERLAEWPERTITRADNAHLLAALAPLVPTPSPVRQAVRRHFARPQNTLGWLLEIARVQVSILRPSFWLTSAVVALLGVYAELAPWNSNAGLYLRAIAPLLAFLGIIAAFRGAGLRMLECEIACPPSALQLTIARLVIVLGYDIGLGLCLGLAFWLRGTQAAAGEVSFLALTLHWLMPLLLVAGLALVLSLRLPVTLASGIAYGSWLTGLSLFYSVSSSVTLIEVNSYTSHELPLGVEIACGLAGLALLTLGTWRLPASIARLLPTF